MGDGAKRTLVGGGVMRPRVPPGPAPSRAWDRVGTVDDVLDVRGLHKRYGDVVALDDVSFRVDDGQMVGFLGPNGSGKTTTMPRRDGRGGHRRRGDPLERPPRRRRRSPPLRLHAGGTGMYPKMQVREHVVYFAELAGLSPTAAERATDAWLERLGLSDRRDTEVQRLSSGNQQRVQLALALVHDPDFLILDEPFSGLDPLAADTIRDILQERVAAGAGALFSSHQLDVVEDVSRDVVIIHRGRIVLDGSVERIRASSQVRYLDISVDEGAPADWVDTIAAAGAEVVGTEDHRARFPAAGRATTPAPSWTPPPPWGTWCGSATHHPTSPRSSAEAVGAAPGEVLDADADSGPGQGGDGRVAQEQGAGR